MTNITEYDVVIIGAGISGLSCAKLLQEKGFKVLVLDKSRGVGGRLATRRLHNTCVDHGFPYLANQGEFSAELIQELLKNNILQEWKGAIYELNFDNSLTKTPPINRYFSPEGITSVAKFLAQNLEIKKQAKVQEICPISNNNWLIKLEKNEVEITAKKVVCSIPAPQALMLIENSPNLNLSEELISHLKSVKFHPRLMLIAGYSGGNDLVKWQGIRLNNDSLRFILLDSTKRNNPQNEAIFILHSTPEFAQEYLDTENLDLAAEKLLNIAANRCNSWFNKPNWYNIHRWRYATVKQALNKAFLTENNLYFCGDWCQGTFFENALQSGILTANNIT